MAKKEKNKEFIEIVKDVFLVIVIIFWCFALIANFCDDQYQMPQSLQIIMTMGAGYLFADRAWDKIVDKYKNKE